MSTVKVGKARYGGEFTKRVYRKLKDGEAVYRILPPMGDLADKGIWSVFYNVHYGYRNLEGQIRTFQSPLVKNRKNKMIEVPDAALERIESLKAQFELAKKEKNAAMVERLDKLVGQKGMYNLDNNHHVNAMDQQGNVVILKLRHRAKLALDATIKRLREGGVDPLDLDNGRFFIFRRTGMGLDTSFQVDILKEKITVSGMGVVEKEIVHVIDDAALQGIAKQVAELDKLYKRPSSEEVANIVKQSDLLTGKSPAIDELFSTAAAPVAATEEDYDDSAEFEQEAPPAAPANQLGASAVAQIVAAQAVAAPVAPPAAPVSASVQPSAKTVSEMSDAEFLEMLKN